MPSVVVCEPIETAVYAQCQLELMGRNAIPRYGEDRIDNVT
jgi:hypothetical protein